MLPDDFSISRFHLLHHDVLCIAISLRSPMTGTEPAVWVLIVESAWVFGLLIILKILIWILIIDFFSHFVWRLLKLLRVNLLDRLLATLLPHALILLEHLIVTFDLLLVRNYVLLRCSGSSVVLWHEALILVICMRIHILWHLSINKK